MRGAIAVILMTVGFGLYSWLGLWCLTPIFAAALLQNALVVLLARRRS